MLLHKLILTNLLSFEKTTLDLKPLNILIGHNGSGKSNLIEAISLIQSAPGSIAAPIREDGGIRDWIWQGAGTNSNAGLKHLFHRLMPICQIFVMALNFQSSRSGNGFIVARQSCRNVGRKETCQTHMTDCRSEGIRSTRRIPHEIGKNQNNHCCMVKLFFNGI
jgi:predicted ATPase